jgi:hypothetical protein
MSKGAKRDMTALHAVEGLAEWIRKGSGALLVLVVRSEDAVVAVDPLIAPGDALTMVEVAMPEAMARLNEVRHEAKQKGRSKAGKMADEVWERERKERGLA